MMLQVAQAQPGIDQRGNTYDGLIKIIVLGSVAGEQGCDLVCLQKVDDPCDGSFHFTLAGNREKVGNGIQYDDLGFVFPDQVIHCDQMHFKTVDRGTGNVELQQPLFYMRGQVDPDRAHIPQDLTGGFLEGEIHAALPALASRVHKRSRDTTLASASCASKQDTAATIETLAVQHFIKFLDPRRYSFCGGLVLESQGCDRQDRNAIFADQERVLVRAVQGAAIFDDPQPPGGNLVSDTVVERNDAIGDIFLKPEAGHGPFAAFRRNHRADTFVLKPAEQALKFGPQDALVVKCREEHLYGVQCHPLGANGVNGMAETDEQPPQVIIAGFLDLTPLHPDMIDDQFLLFAQLL